MPANSSLDYRRSLTSSSESIMMGNGQRISIRRYPYGVLTALGPFGHCHTSSPEQRAVQVGASLNAPHARSLQVRIPFAYPAYLRAPYKPSSDARASRITAAEGSPPCDRMHLPISQRLLLGWCSTCPSTQVVWLSSRSPKGFATS